MTGVAATVATNWPSVDDVQPEEQGGPTARTGLNYQDEIAVSLLLDMLTDAFFVKIHCETHDDIVAIRSDDAHEYAEYVQVKAGEPNKLWTVADLCAGSAGSSIFEKSLGRDGCREISRFRLVTLRPVASDLKLLTYPCYGTGREPCSDGFLILAAELKQRFPNALSKKGNGADYWIKHCHWEQRHSEDAVRHMNLLRMMRVSAAEGSPLLPEQADVLADELRKWTAEAGAAKWKPDRKKKIINREDLRAWWENRLKEIADGATSPSGGKLSAKMEEAQLTEDQLRMAMELRRDYARLVRTPRYMEESRILSLQSRVRSELASLRGRLVGGQLMTDGKSFHSLCLDRMDIVNDSRPLGADDQSAFLKGCMYDITDRCLHRFVGPTR